LIQKNLEKLLANRTSIIIAHRLSTVVNADTIVVLQPTAALTLSQTLDRAAEVALRSAGEMGIPVHPLRDVAPLQLLHLPRVYLLQHHTQRFQVRVHVGDNPHVKPLAHLLDAYGGYGVVLVDKQGARVFYFHLGELREQEGVMGESVRHTKRGGASTVPGRRGGVAGRKNNTEEVTERNMKEAAEFATHFFGEKNVRRVLIGGTDDNVAQFRSMLPKAWQSLIVGAFPMSMTASKDEVLERAMQIGQASDRGRESQLADTIVTNAAKGRGGVVRLDDTLSAVHEGRVQTLLIREGFHAPGYRCQGCGYLTAQSIAICPFCGNAFVQIPDAVEMAVHNVMQHGGDVEVLHDLLPEQLQDLVTDGGQGLAFQLCPALAHD
jgi:peptide subunit release factor 1 (eRF1)